jgi:hypothetical protein
MRPPYALGLLLMATLTARAPGFYHVGRRIAGTEAKALLGNVQFSRVRSDLSLCPQGQSLGRCRHLVQGRRGSGDGPPDKPSRGKKKGDLPEKVCVVCGRPFTWRKKWEKVGDERNSSPS